MRYIFILVLIILAGSVYADCGNGVCETTENCDNCMEDCPIDIMNAPQCLLDKDNCNSIYERAHLINAAILFTIVGIFIYLRNRGFI